MNKWFIAAITLYSAIHLQAQDTLPPADTLPSAETQTALESPPRFEIGVLLGEPINLSVKYWTTTITAINGAAGWSFTEDGLFETHLDFLLHPFNIQAITGGANFPLYIGPGLGLRIGDDWFLGARLPIGAEYIIRGLPLSIFGEIAPQWQFIPDNDFVLSGGIGIRLTFGQVQ